VTRGKYATKGRAILAALKQVRPGGRVYVHEKTCASAYDGRPCDCRPVILRREKL
jgi:hypothetical protein